ncbi:MAG: hypothetical protein N3A65_09425 [candidate division WOR-3 bacterium]|nr:hypothetical protein [candidate division WOR-3 bacterium]
MNTCRKFVLIALLFVLPIIVFAQNERWVYRYSGMNTYRYDEAYCLVYGGDGYIYIGGYTYNDGTNRDFTVISLTNSAQERWVYKYPTIGNNWDACYSICYGNDGNIYALGDCTGSDGHLHFTIISLGANGIQRWIYQYPDASYGDAICYGGDGCIYGVGCTEGKILVVSIDTNGAENWRYIYPTPPGDLGIATSVVYCPDGNIYITGYTGPVLNKDLIVISLSSGGLERWVYLYNGSGNSHDYGKCIANAPDSKLYVFGSTCFEVGPYLYSDGLVLSLTNAGNERWTYMSAAALSEFEGGAYSVDENLYVVGNYGWDIPSFLVESISDSGTYRWLYTDTTWGFGQSIVYGDDGNIYAGGITSDTWQGGKSYFTVISFANNGTRNWLYIKRGWRRSNDVAHSVIYGLDGNIYAAGTLCDSITWNDFTVISLSSTGIEENKRLNTVGERLNLVVSPNVVRENARIQFSLPERQYTRLTLYDVLGRKVATIVDGVFEGGYHFCNLCVCNLNSGIYFLILEDKKEKKAEKILVVR